MASGVKLGEDVTSNYQQVKTKKKNPYIIFKLSDDKTQIVVDRIGEEGETFDDFRGKMLEAANNGEGRYAVYDMVEDEQGKRSNKTGDLIFIVWISDSQCKIKEKMLYTSSKSVIKNACVGFKKEVQINDPNELTLEEIREKIK